MEHKPLPIIAFPLFKSLAWLLGCTVLLAALTGGVLAALQRMDQFADAMAAMVICTALGAIGFVLMAVLSRKVAHGAAMGFMASTGIRLIGCGSVAVLALARGGDSMFVYWLAGMYLALLVIEVAIVAAILSRDFHRLEIKVKASGEICA